MKQINFVSPISKETKKEVKRWMIISGILTVAIILFISISLFAHCYHYYLLQAQRAQAMEDHSHCVLVLQTQKEKDSTNSSRSDRLDRLHRYQYQPESIANNLRACNQKIGTGALQSCTLSKQSLELAYKSATIAQAQKTMDALQKIPGISNLELVALQRHTSGVISTIRAKVMKS